MGTTTVPIGFERCGACRYWGGNVQVHENGGMVEYDMYETARCRNNQSPIGGQEVSADHYCFSYKSY